MIESLLSPGHLILIGLAALLLVGPKRLPEVGRGLGKALREFKSATSEMTDGLKAEMHESEAPKASAPVAAMPLPAPAATNDIETPLHAQATPVQVEVPTQTPQAAP